jgi:hypothetical protein
MFTMAALEAATQPARVRAPSDSLAPAGAGALGGRVKPGHGEVEECYGFGGGGKGPR